jgi:hypothetical protein
LEGCCRFTQCTEPEGGRKTLEDGERGGRGPETNRSPIKEEESYENPCIIIVINNLTPFSCFVYAFYLLVVYLTTLSVDQNTQRQKAGWSVNN